MVLSAPSGTGKSTVAKRLVGATAGLEFSVSYTTRPRRDGERAGKDYRFIDPAEFQSLIDRDALLEWASVFGERYGTGREVTSERIDRGVDVVLDIDVQGAEQVRRADLPCVSVMLLPPDHETLRSRLAGRGTESEQALALRLDQARREIEQYVRFDYVIVNSELEETTAELQSILRAERCRADRCRPTVERILATFPD